ncbi:Rz1 family lipoprotein [Vibrio viridaestus]
MSSADRVAQAWIMQPPPDWQTPLNGIISPSERG